MSENRAYSSICGNNHAQISGRLETNFIFSHLTMLESFYQTRVKVVRLSGNMDYVPIIVSEQLVSDYLNKDITDIYVEVVGTMRSFNRWMPNGSYRLEIFLFASGFNMYSDEAQIPKYDKNSVTLEGYLGRVPEYRRTPFGREITDLMVAINSWYDRSYYIPCITWGKSAIYSAKLNMGDKVQLYGRIQSREYTKVQEGLPSEVRTVYEISAYSISQILDDENK